MGKEKKDCFFDFLKKRIFRPSVIFIVALLAVGGVLLGVSYHFEGFTQNLLMGLGTGGISSAIITLAFELHEVKLKKDKLKSFKIIIQQPLIFFIAQILEDLDLFLRNQEKDLEGLLIDLKRQSDLSQYKMEIIVDREVRKSKLQELYNISMTSLALELISLKQYQDITCLHFYFNSMHKELKRNGHVPSELFVDFLSEVYNCIDDFDFLQIYKNLIYKKDHWELKALAQQHYTPEERWAMMLLLNYKEEKEQEKND